MFPLAAGLVKGDFLHKEIFVAGLDGATNAGKVGRTKGKVHGGNRMTK
jgi:hypothetical protein